MLEVEVDISTWHFLLPIWKSFKNIGTKWIEYFVNRFKYFDDNLYILVQILRDIVMTTIKTAIFSIYIQGCLNLGMFIIASETTYFQQ